MDKPWPEELREADLFLRCLGFSSDGSQITVCRCRVLPELDQRQPHALPIAADVLKFVTESATCSNGHRQTRLQHRPDVLEEIYLDVPGLCAECDAKELHTLLRRRSNG